MIERDEKGNIVSFSEDGLFPSKNVGSSSLIAATVPTSEEEIERLWNERRFSIEGRRLEAINRLNALFEEEFREADDLKRLQLEALKKAKDADAKNT